jgi:glycosyltransferase involved in cell wall biosynthesis
MFNNLSNPAPILSQDTPSHKMRIAFIVPALAHKGPVIVVRDIIGILRSLPGIFIEVFYFDDIREIEMGVACQRIPAAGFTEILASFDIVHSHGFRPDKYVFKHRAKIKGQCISTMHNIIFEEYKSNYNPLIGKLVEQLWIHHLKRHDEIICLTEAMRRYYKKLLPDKKIVVVHTGRKLSTEGMVQESDLGAIENLRGKYKIIGAVCRVTKRKGLHQVINALDRLSEYAFLLVGDGPELKNLKTLALKKGLEKRCVFLGTRKDAIPYFRYFDLYAMSSYSEGLPLALLEAAGNGIPALCSDIELHRELFSNDEVAFFTLDNKRSFQDAALRVSADTAGFSRRIKEKFINQYTQESMAQHYLEIYNALIQ